MHQATTAMSAFNAAPSGRASGNESRTGMLPVPVQSGNRLAMERPGHWMKRDMRRRNSPAAACLQHAGNQAGAYREEQDGNDALD